ncbi:serine protease [Streptomyces sp. NPDC018610]|uniref:serine protease n=1 Tax=Streptomyces sp. NPDC018610 TaxID=3365049 RepID=UPI0037B21EBA
MNSPLPGGLSLGPSHERVAAVLCDGRTGSGYLLAARLVLTAAHVVGDNGSARAMVVRGSGAQQCEVVWRRHDGECDAALLASRRALVRPETATRLRPVTWARLTDESPVRCQAMGFPRAQWGQGRNLDIEHIECALRPASGIVRGRYVLDVKDVSPELASGRSPWEGMSGAALFARGGILGLVVEAPHNWRHQRLEAIKSRALLDDASFASALKRYTGDRPFTVDLSSVPRRPKPYRLAGVPHTTPRDLAVTLRAGWDVAREQLFEGGAAARGGSDKVQELSDWLRQFDDPVGGVETHREATDQALADPQVGDDLKVLRLLCRLDPEGEPVWRGTAVTGEMLARACLRGFENSGPELELFEALREGGLLETLAGFTRLRWMAGMQDAWTEAQAAWLRMIERAPDLPSGVSEWARGEAKVLLLVGLLTRHSSVARLRAFDERATPPPAGRVGWYDWMRSRDGGPETAIGWVVRTALAAYATAEFDDAEAAERTAKEAAEARMARVLEHAREGRDRDWARLEAERCSSRAQLGAVTRAAAWMGVWGVVLVSVSWLMWGWARPDVAWRVAGEFGALSLAAFLGRLRTVLRLGAAYRPPVEDLGRWLRDEGFAAGVGRVCVIAALSLVAGVIAHSGFWFVACLVLALTGVLVTARVGIVQDWDEDYQKRLKEFRSRQDGTVWSDITRDAQSPSPADRAKAYQKFTEQFGGLSPGSKDVAK